MVKRKSVQNCHSGRPKLSSLRHMLNWKVHVSSLNHYQWLTASILWFGWPHNRHHTDSLAGGHLHSMHLMQWDCFNLLFSRPFELVLSMRHHKSNGSLLWMKTLDNSWPTLSLYITATLVDRAVMSRLLNSRMAKRLLADTVCHVWLILDSRLQGNRWLIILSKRYTDTVMLLLPGEYN